MNSRLFIVGDLLYPFDFERAMALFLWLITKCVPIIWQRTIRTIRNERSSESLRKELSDSLSDEVRKVIHNVRWLLSLPFGVLLGSWWGSMSHYLLPVNAKANHLMPLGDSIETVMLLFVPLIGCAIMAPRFKRATVAVALAVYSGCFVLILRIYDKQTLLGSPYFDKGFWTEIVAVVVGVGLAFGLAWRLDRRQQQTLKP